MNTNEIIENEEVIEVTEDIANISSGKGFEMAACVGLGVFVGIFAYKCLIKPMLAKIKVKKEQHTIKEEIEIFDEVEAEESEESK